MGVGSGGDGLGHVDDCLQASPEAFSWESEGFMSCQYFETHSRVRSSNGSWILRHTAPSKHSLGPSGKSLASALQSASTDLSTGSGFILLSSSSIEEDTLKEFAETEVDMESDAAEDETVVE